LLLIQVCALLYSVGFIITTTETENSDTNENEVVLAAVDQHFTDSETVLQHHHDSTEVAVLNQSPVFQVIISSEHLFIDHIKEIQTPGYFSHFCLTP
jgi:hypothetical protein